MHHLVRPTDDPTERLGDDLMTETDPENRDVTGKLSHDRERDTRVLCTAGTRGKDDVTRVHATDFFYTMFIIPDDADVTEAGDVLIDVIRERIVVIDEENHANTSKRDLALSKLGENTPNSKR